MVTVSDATIPTDVYGILAVVLLDCQYEYENTIPYEDFFDYSESQIKTILSRYNGYGEEAVKYGNICYEYYEIFENINNWFVFLSGAY